VQEQPNDRLDLWFREGYKAVDLNEPVPTPSGWTTHGALNVGDWVFGASGQPIRVLAKTEVYTEADCWRVTFKNGYSVVVSGDHLWTVQRWSTKRIDGNVREGFVPATMNTRSIAARDDPMGKRLSVAVASPIVMPAAMLPIEPYTFGAWLGGGHQGNGRITSGDPEIFEEIERRGYKLSTPPPASKEFYPRTVYGIHSVLKDMGASRNKHIPMAYKRGSVEQRMDLLRGLMDTDGSCDTRGKAAFTNKTKRLAEDVFELVAGLSLKPSLREYEYDHGMVYQVCFQAYKSRRPFGLSRKNARCKNGEGYLRHQIVSVEPVDPIPVSCIQVDAEDGLYMIGEHHILTHNSTIITFALTIQDILNDPEITIGLASHTRPIAKAFMRQIMREFEGNETLKAWFPDILWENPRKQSPKWSEDEGIVVIRKSNPKEATIEAWGVVDGQPTSKHYKLLVYDDIVTRESVTSPDMMAKTTDALALSYNLGAHGGSRRFIGTRYHYNDTYRTLMDRGTVTPRIYPATDNGKMDGNPVFHTVEALAEKRRDMGPYVFGAQMMQDPTADETQGFKEEWLKYAQPNPNGLNIYMIFDPASSKKKDSDYTAGWVIGMGADRNIYVLDMARDRLSLTQRADLVIGWHRHWRPLAVGYERYGMMADIEHILFRQEQENYRFPIVELGGQMPKVDRIRRLIPWFEGGRIWMPQIFPKTNYEGRSVDLAEAFRKEEYLPFPVGLHDDMLDALARVLDDNFPAEWPMSYEHVEEDRNDNRSTITGY
jgi:phage terminase large subunit-like protein